MSGHTIFRHTIARTPQWDAFVDAMHNRKQKEAPMEAMGIATRTQVVDDGDGVKWEIFSLDPPIEVPRKVGERKSFSKYVALTACALRSGETSMYECTENGRVRSGAELPGSGSGSCQAALHRAGYTVASEVAGRAEASKDENGHTARAHAAYQEARRAMLNALSLKQSKEGAVTDARLALADADKLLHDQAKVFREATKELARVAETEAGYLLEWDK